MIFEKVHFFHQKMVTFGHYFDAHGESVWALVLNDAATTGTPKGQFPVSVMFGRCWEHDVYISDQEEDGAGTVTPNSSREEH